MTIHWNVERVNEAIDVRSTTEGGCATFGVRCNRPEALELLSKLASALNKTPAEAARICNHEHVIRGADVPRRWGSFQSRICLDCRHFHCVEHSPAHLSRTMWKPLSEYETVIAQSEDD